MPTFIQRFVRWISGERSNAVVLLDEAPVQDHEYLRCLERLRVSDPASYQYVLQRHINELGRARRVTLFTAAHSRDFIANASMARDMKCRTLATLIDDMSRTVDKIEEPDKQPEYETVPAALQEV